MRSTVLFPDPEGPSSAVIAPAGAVNVTSRTASNEPKRFEMPSTTIGVLMCGSFLSSWRWRSTSITSNRTTDTAARTKATMYASAVCRSS